MLVPFCGSIGTVTYVIHLRLVTVPFANIIISVVSAWLPGRKSSRTYSQCIYGVCTASPIINLLFVPPYKRWRLTRNRH